MLKERQRSILNAAIRRHVRTAEPVASRELLSAIRPLVSPATIRGEMSRLDELGYLAQPYTSSGRIPTDRGWRFYIDHLIRTPAISKNDEARIEAAFEENGEEEFVRAFSKAIAAVTSMFVAVGNFEDGVLFETGIPYLFEKPEFREEKQTAAFARLLNELDEVPADFFEEFLKKPRTRIFVGGRHPFLEGDMFSFAVSSWRHRRGFRGFITLVGPKRMDYERFLSVLECLARHG
jgi:heat-inducible transcriptional repressor